MSYDVKVNCTSRHGYTLEVMCGRRDEAVPSKRLTEALCILEATEGLGEPYYTDVDDWLDAVIAVFRATPLWAMHGNKPMRLGIPYQGTVVAVDVTDHG